MSGHREAPTTTRQETSQASRDLDCSSHCPFCNILLAFPPVDPLGDPQEIAQILDHEKTNPPCVVVYSGERVMAFLDIQPLTWGHTLVIPRRHRVRMGDLEAADGAELGRHLPLITRAVMRAVFDLPYDAERLEVEGADYNIVQNNGPLAAQVVPHIHHHIIPRPSGPHPRFRRNGNPAPAHLPQMTSKYHASWTMFGRGHRTDLDETDPETQQLAQRIRHEIALEFCRGDLEKSFGNNRRSHGNSENEDVEFGDVESNNNNNNPSSGTNPTGTRALDPRANPYISSASRDKKIASTRSSECRSPFSEKALATNITSSVFVTDAEGCPSPEAPQTQRKVGKASYPNDQLPSPESKQKGSSKDMREQQQQQRDKNDGSGFPGPRAVEVEVRDQATENAEPFGSRKGKGKL